MTQNRHAMFVQGQHISSIYSRHHHSSDDRSAVVADRSVSPQSVLCQSKPRNDDHGASNVPSPENQCDKKSRKGHETADL